MNTLYVQSIPQISLEGMEKVLKHLPEPNSVHVSLTGKFDYSSLYSQAQEVNPDIKIGGGGGSHFLLENPSKEKILNIYKKSGVLAEETSTQESYEDRRISFHNASWSLDDEVHTEPVQIELTSYEVNVNYKGKEPAYISQMRQDLAETNVTLITKVND